MTGRQDAYRHTGSVTPLVSPKGLPLSLYTAQCSCGWYGGIAGRGGAKALLRAHREETGHG